MIVTKYLKYISEMNDNIQKFLDNPKFIDWEYHEIDFNKNDKQMKFSIINPKILIFSKILDLLSFLAKGSNNISDNLIRNMFSLKNLIEVLSNTYPLALKISVLNFFINAYFFVEKSKILPIINEIVSLINEDFFKHLNSYMNRCQTKNNLSNHILFSNNYNDIFQKFSFEYISINLAFFIILLIKINKKVPFIIQIINEKIIKPLEKYVLVKLTEPYF
jgi:hypothetical protein